MSNRTLAIIAAGTLILATPAAASAQTAGEGYGAVAGTQVVPPAAPLATQPTPPVDGASGQGMAPADGAPGQGKAPADVPGQGKAPADVSGVLGERDSGTAPANVADDAPTGVAGVADSGAAPPTAPVAGSQAAPAVAAATADEPGGSLPFTGMDLLLVALGGALLMAVGFTLVHVNRKPTA